MPNTAEILASAWTAENTNFWQKPPSCQVPKFSFEYFPPKTQAGVEALLNRVYRMSRQQPLFVDLTWGAGGSTSELTMELSTKFKETFGVEVNMHLTCTNITSESVKDALVTAKAKGLTSICALRGDPPVGAEKWAATEGGFNCALDLVRFIRKEHGRYFGVAVAGYPEGHPLAIKEVLDESKLTASERSRLIHLDEGKLAVCHDADFASEMAYLKQKVDAGADLIITQLFYDVDVFLAFVSECRARGINVPILPGIMPIATYGGFKRMTDFCKTRIPSDLRALLEPLKADDKAVAEAGLHYVTAMCKRIWATNTVSALHFYCLNQHATVFRILESLGVAIDPLDRPADAAELARVAALAKEISATVQLPK